MNIIILALLFFFVFCNADGKSSKNELNILIDSLSSAEFDNKYRQDEVFRLTQKMSKIGGDDITNALYTFALTNKEYGDNAIIALYAIHPKDFGDWVQNGQKQFSERVWKAIARHYEVTGYKWRDTTLTKVIIDNAINMSNDYLRGHLLSAVSETASFAEASRIYKMYETEMDIDCRCYIFNTICRYKYAEFDSILKNSIENYAEHEVINYWLENGLKKYDRYDFLGQLITLQIKLKDIKDVTKKAQAKETLGILCELIPYLQQKKKENAPIVLPLNWTDEE